CARVLPLADLTDELVDVAAPAHATLHPDGRGIASGVSRRRGAQFTRVVERVAGRDLREPAIGQPAHAAIRRIRRTTDPNRDRALCWEWREPRRRDLLVLSLVRDRWLGPQPP